MNGRRKHVILDSTPISKENPTFPKNHTSKSFTFAGVVFIEEGHSNFNSSRASPVFFTIHYREIQSLLIQ